MISMARQRLQGVEESSLRWSVKTPQGRRVRNRDVVFGVQGVWPGEAKDAFLAFAVSNYRLYKDLIKKSDGKIVEAVARRIYHYMTTIDDRQFFAWDPDLGSYIYLGDSPEDHEIDVIGPIAVYLQSLAPMHQMLIGERTEHNDLRKCSPSHYVEYNDIDETWHRISRHRAKGLAREELLSVRILRLPPLALLPAHTEEGGHLHFESSFSRAPPSVAPTNVPFLAQQTTRSKSNGSALCRYRWKCFSCGLKPKPSAAAVR